MTKVLHQKIQPARPSQWQGHGLGNPARRGALERFYFIDIGHGFAHIAASD
jgi:hypothetical protein